MFINTISYQQYLASGGSPAICAAAATISCIKEPEYIHFNPHQVTLHYRHAQDSLALTLAPSAARVTCHVTLNSYGLDIFSLPDDFESLFDLMHKHVDIKNIALAYNITASRRDQMDPGLIFGRMYACAGALFTQFAGQSIAGVSLRNAVHLDAFLSESSQYALTAKGYLCLSITKGAQYCITFSGAEMMLSINSQHTMQTFFIEDLLRELEQQGLSVLPYSSEFTSVTNTGPYLQPSGATDYFSSDTDSTVTTPQNQGHPYNIRITETYTREVVLYATTTQELGAKALELTKNHPETFGDGFNKAGVTIKRLS